VYRAADGSRAAVVLWDASEDLRGRETAHSESLMTASRVLLASFAHEVRNFASAAKLLTDRMQSRPDLQGDRDFGALVNTLESLSQFAASGLRIGINTQKRLVDAGAALEQIRIVIQPVLDGAEMRLVWDVPTGLPVVRGDHSSLAQVFLNLLRNAEHATRALDKREFKVSAWADDGLTIKVCDNGPGVDHPEKLFQPFCSGSGSSGLGLYVSRAILRSYGGDLAYEPAGEGACFVIRLQGGSVEWNHADSFAAGG
jgi:signal transduction histidine kinase